MKRHRVAVAGTGFIGPVHVEALRRAGQEVVGILGSRPEKSQSAADAMGIPRGYASFEELLGDDSLDAVHLATPNRLHFSHASQALARGLHVMCEKPLAMTADESVRLVEIARESGMAAGVNYNIRYYPLAIEARERVRGGEIGRVISVFGGYVQDWLLYDTDYNWRVLAEEGGDLRAVSDIGTHWLDLVLHITGETPVAVFADLRTVYPERRRPVGEVQTFTNEVGQDLQPVAISTEDTGAVLVRCASGAQLVLWVSQMTAGRKNCLRYEISGTESALAWNSETPNELWIGHRTKPNQVLLRDPSLLSPAAAEFTSYPGGHNEGFPDTFKQLYRDFYGFISGEDPSAEPRFPTFADGHREIVLCEAILASHRAKTWVELPQ
jgi:predicted dehydrogenase